ncbi:MAG: type II/IV secretion system protein [Verrucomicrobia bacterium]|nr:type II/IV secretion system protein [Verrucomicrobiota bacterium]
MQLSDYLIRNKYATQSQLNLAERLRKLKGGLLSDILIDLGFVSAEIVYDFLASEAETTFVNLKNSRIEKEVLEKLPYETAVRLRAVPVRQVNGTLTVALADPLDVVAIDSIRHITGLNVEVNAATENDILSFLDENSFRGDGIEESIDEVLEEEDEFLEAPVKVPALDLANADEEEAPVIRLVAKIINNAVKNGASDIHFEPDEMVMRIRTRTDGILRQDVLIPKSMQSAVATRVKILADLDVAETRVPQDGRAAVFVQRRQINLRVSSLPTAFGENIVVRILDPGSQVKNLTEMGMLPEMEQQLLEMVCKPYGVVVVTGPTGSGKSTSLYAVLNHVSTIQTSVFTLEDPIEYRMKLVRQTQVQEEVGLTFSRGLRSLLRQDPDVILVGETRDQETAQLMVRAALTGHLVFTTLHTNDAVGAIPRLIDMGVEPFLLPASLIGVVGQRLVRRICHHCKMPMENPQRTLEHFRVEMPNELPLQLWQGTGCDDCENTGYKGRVGIYELLNVDDRFHEPILKRASSQEYAKLAAEAGMKTMFEDGLTKATLGQTTLEELMSVTKI